MELRPYQVDIKNNVLDEWKDDPTKNILMVKPTGSGKTVTMASIIKTYNKPTCAIAHRQELVGQISLALAREGVLHKVIAPKSVIKSIVKQHVQQLGISFHSPFSDVGVASVDTIISREEKLKHWVSNVRLWVIDEAHHVLKKNKWGKAVNMFKNACGLGFTATPQRADGSGLGKENDGVFDIMINGPSMGWLIHNGFLSDYRVFAPQSDINTDIIKVSPSGDFSPSQLRLETRKSKIVGDVVLHYKEIALNKKGVVFSTDIELASIISDKFNQEGIKSECVSSKTPAMQRDKIISDFREDKLQVLVNVDLFGEGFDLPSIEVVSMARPTMSLGLYVQQFGRALRVMDGKDKAIIIDHVGNVHRHGLPDRNMIWSLDRRDKGSKKNKEKEFTPIKTCRNCIGVYEAVENECPYCGHKNTPEKRNRPEEVDGNLIELSEEALRELRDEISRIDKPVSVVRHNMMMSGANRAAVGGAIKNHKRRQEAQAELRHTIALWAANQRQIGRDDASSYKRFFWKYGIDVLSAQALGAKQAISLKNKISLDMLTKTSNEL